MDARIKSGHDGCALWRDRSPAFRTDPKFIFKQPLRCKHSFAISPRVSREFCYQLAALSNQRAWGTPGALGTRGLVCTLYW
jgi:hypothetical protein